MFKLKEEIRIELFELGNKDDVEIKSFVFDNKNELLFKLVYVFRLLDVSFSLAPFALAPKLIRLRPKSATTTVRPFSLTKQLSDLRSR